jgi:hypothetical protein
MTRNSGSESSDGLISAVIGFVFAACVVGVFYCGFPLLHELFGRDFIFGGIMLVMDIMMKVIGGVYAPNTALKGNTRSLKLFGT